MKTCLLLLLATCSFAARPEKTSLNGSWRFAIDPTRGGEQSHWQDSGIDDSHWDTVAVPHCWPLDARYRFTGAAW